MLNHRFCAIDRDVAGGDACACDDGPFHTTVKVLLSQMIVERMKEIRKSSAGFLIENLERVE
jgi:hypothetical protein